jgi:hypothetical protein
MAEDELGVGARARSLVDGWLGTGNGEAAVASGRLRRRLPAAWLVGERRAEGKTEAAAGEEQSRALELLRGGEGKTCFS